MRSSQKIGSPLPDDTALPPQPARLLGLTARIVAAYASGSRVTAASLPRLITSVRQTLSELGQPEESEPARGAPAVPIRRSIRPDRLICLECGAEMTMLRRHLRIGHGLTPEAYRMRWRLRFDYPMVAPHYAETRSGIARQFGLGRKRGPAMAALPEPEAELDAAPEMTAEDVALSPAAPRTRAGARRPKKAGKKA